MHIFDVFFEVCGLCELLGAMHAGVRFLSCVSILVPFQVVKVQKSFLTVRTPVSLLPIVPP